MARGKRHSDETRAAVMAALLAGQGVSEVARQYDLDVSLVSRWRKQMPASELQEVATKREEDFGDLLAAYIRETLITLAEHQRMARDREWFGRQAASEIGTFGGIHLDKVVRLLDAAQRAAERAASSEEAGTE